MEEILSKLNEPQREAVTTTDGPVLVIAGAGSGKTRALTHRVAYLIREKKVPPMQILAVTFTNKAAGEMKERIIDLLGGNRSFFNLPFVGTFHSLCVRILRREIEKLGYGSNFNIFDVQDQQSLMKKVLEELQIDPTQFRPKALLESISKAKNELIDQEEFERRIAGYWEEMVSKIYAAYQKKLKEVNALDFDDLLSQTIRLFKQFPEVLEKYQNQFRYVMVDEYQDTNHAQYTLVKMLSEKFQNICVVGDDWQGIYSWRGADIQNILDFEKDYPNAKVVKLEQNYRSTQKILDAAYGIISKNTNRKDKKVWTENQHGHQIVSFEARDEKEEAEFVVGEIESLKKTGASLNDMVVLYRTNAQSRIIEEAMLQAAFPYRIIGGVKFYQRKEVKDMIAYLRLISNHEDLISLERIINEPRRNIGPATIAKWTAFCREKKLDLISGGSMIDQETSFLNQGKIKGIRDFSLMILKAREKLIESKLSDFMFYVFSASGYEKFLLDGTQEGETRKENVMELFTVAKKHDELPGNEALAVFLEEVALIADTDSIDQASECVHLMTLHSAKGLEFRFVFIIGLEEGLLPHSRSLLSNQEMEEERRLMYVGVTRAKEKVYLIYTQERNIFGSTQISSPSRFLYDIPDELMESNSFSQKISETKKEMKKEVREAPVFKGGEKVNHETFGDGIVVASQGDIITVAFQKVGLKKLAASIAPIRKI